MSPFVEIGRHENKPIWEEMPQEKIDKNLKSDFNPKGIIVETRTPIYKEDEFGVARQVGTKVEYKLEE